MALVMHLRKVMKLRKYFDFRTFSVIFIMALIISTITAYTTGLIYFGPSVGLINSTIINAQAENIAMVYKISSRPFINRLLDELYKRKKVLGYVIDDKGLVYGIEPVPAVILELAQQMKAGKLQHQAFMEDAYTISREIMVDESMRIRLLTSTDFISTSKEKLFLYNLIKTRVIAALIFSLLFSIGLMIFIKQRISKSFPIIEEISKGNFIDGESPVGIQGGYGVELLKAKLQEMSKKLQSIMASKNRLLIDISHELRSPLSRQEIAIDIAKLKVNEQQQAHLERIETENHKLQALISEIMVFAKEDRINYRLLIESVSLSDLIQGIVDDAQFEFANANIEYGSDDAYMLEVDPNLIHRALENVIRNALKHANTKAPKVSIKISKMGANYEISVKDNGVGVLEHNLELIFAPFYREDRQKDMSKFGYGIGLSITKNVIQAHHGSIRAQNLAGGGLEVIITLPVVC